MSRHPVAVLPPWRAVAALAVVLLVAGCAGAVEEAQGGPRATRTGGGSVGAAAPPTQPAPPRSPSAPISPAPTLGSAEGEADAVLSTEMLQRLKADLAGRVDVAVDEIEIVSSRRRTFPDGSLGCPEPGKFYTQALVDGGRVILDAGGQRYDYRVSDRGEFKLCERPGAGANSTGVTPRPFPTRRPSAATDGV